MEELKKHKLGDLCVFQEGYVNPSQGIAKYFNGNIKWIRAIDLNNGKVFNTTRTLTDEGFKSAGKSAMLFKPGTIVLSKSGTIGRLGLIQDFMCGNRATINIAPKNNTNILYIFYNLLSRQDEIANLAVGSVQKNLYVSILEQMDIMLPSESIQKKTVELLSSIDDKIEINNRINHNLEEQAQALYKSWFVDFEPFKDGKFVDSELGMIPEGWSVVPFLSLAKLCSGGTPKTDIKEFWNGNIPFFTPKDVKGSTFCLITEKTISEPGLNNCNSRLYSPYTIFITARGTVGKLCMAGIPMAMNQTNYAICPSESIDPVVLYLITKQLILKLQNKANGAVFDAITTRDFEGEYILASTPSVLNKFAQIVRPIYERILQNDKQTLALAQYRDALLPQLMTGSLITNNL